MLVFKLFIFMHKSSICAFKLQESYFAFIKCHSINLAQSGKLQFISTPNTNAHHNPGLSGACMYVRIFSLFIGHPCLSKWFKSTGRSPPGAVLKAWRPADARADWHELNTVSQPKSGIFDQLREKTRVSGKNFDCRNTSI